MGLLDKVNAGAERAAMEAWKAFDKGKAKAAELQLEMRMDSAAKKLGYLVFDEHRGRGTDEKARQRLLDSLVGLDEEMMKLRAETAARVAGRDASAAGRAAADSQSSANSQPGSGAADVAASGDSTVWPPADASVGEDPVAEDGGG